MGIFLEDVLAGIVMVVAAVLMLVALVAYRRYRLGAAALSAVVFFIFLLKGLIYELNIYFNWGLNIISTFMLIDAVILLFLYFALALRSDSA